MGSVNTQSNGHQTDVAIALAPNDLDAVPRLLEEITAGVEALKNGGDAARHDLAIKARTMMLALEAPRETMIKHVWGQVSRLPDGACVLCQETSSCVCALWYSQQLVLREVPLLVSTMALIRAFGGTWRRTATDLRKFQNWPRPWA